MLLADSEKGKPYKNIVAGFSPFPAKFSTCPKTNFNELPLFSASALVMLSIKGGPSDLGMKILQKYQKNHPYTHSFNFHS